MPVQTALTHTNDAGQGFFEMDLRFGLNEPCETAHIYLTALARFAQWAGYYACTLVALLRGGALTILTGMLTGRHDLACFHEVCVSYTQFSKPERRKMPQYFGTLPERGWPVKGGPKVGDRC
jgi:hypothetical protein